jgi:hypothetical protein
LDCILRCQRDPFEDYLGWYAEHVPTASRWIATVLRRSIKRYLLR